MLMLWGFYVLRHKCKCLYIVFMACISLQTLGGVTRRDYSHTTGRQLLNVCCYLIRSAHIACNHPSAALSSFYLLFSLMWWGDSDQPLVLEYSMKKIQVKFLRFQLKRKDATSHWDQFKMSVSVSVSIHIVWTIGRGKQGGCVVFPHDLTAYL